MSVIESISEASSKAIDHSEIYINKTKAYYKLKVFKHLTISVSTLFKVVVIGGLLLLGVIFLAVSLAIYFGKLLESFVLGFVIVGFIFIVIACFLMLVKGSIDAKIIQKLSKTYFNND